MNDFIKTLMNREDKKQIAQKSIVDYLKYSIRNQTNSLESEYNFLQNKPKQNRTNQTFTRQQLAKFCRGMTDIMMSYYKDKEVTAGTNEFFQMYGHLGENQFKEKAILAYNFFFTETSDANYPFKYHTDQKVDGETVHCSCGRNFGHFQNKLTTEVLTENNAGKGLVADFLHLYPLGDNGGEKITKRIYINTTPENATQISLDLFKKCAEHPDDKNYHPYLKFHDTDWRNDTMLVYCTEKNFNIMFDLIHQIYEEHKEWFNGTGKLPLTAQVFDENNHLLLGVADEPTVEGTSFNDFFCENVIEPFKIDLQQKFGVDCKGLSKLPADVIDKYVTYDNLKPYIEKICYSVDYPFLTKETVKNKKLQTEKTVESDETIIKNTVLDTQNLLYNNDLPKELIDMGVR